MIVIRAILFTVLQGFGIVGNIVGGLVPIFFSFADLHSLDALSHSAYCITHHYLAAITLYQLFDWL